ncbi:VanZ family protein [Paucibacter sp. APW11]|uniref:VanZ family protein n=1 Tax=Roseateles aquae TaxID=3077235 RepID=A0ABU3PFW6_9BURK|nr:VanZ family protein [Paucibacter sp. APW11]MDT9001421.1 VanZ family protein [Paucibacter sp. APW11]
MFSPSTRHWRLLFLIALGFVSCMALTPQPPQQIDLGWDKANHGSAFTVLYLLARCSWPARRWQTAAGLLAYGGLVELLQLQIPGRSGEWLDLFADGCGIALGLALAGLGERYLARRGQIRH